MILFLKAYLTAVAAGVSHSQFYKGSIRIGGERPQILVKGKARRVKEQHMADLPREILPDIT
jgi:hypothetical protein